MGRINDAAEKARFLAKVGFRVKVLRTEAELSQAELAAMMSMTRGGIANIEGGKVNMGIASLNKLVKACGSDLQSFIKGIKQ